MGLDYSYEVYVHRDAARGVLETLKANCADRLDRTTTVEFPDGPLVMPCTSHFASGTTVRFDPAVPQRGSLLELDLAISFEADDELLAWMDQSGGPYLLRFHGGDHLHESPVRSLGVDS
ncbi:hypothetical protein [Nocardia sp. NPDC020380]|uniref:hypothetical protein n=1 Tax=Nocardia sp. NPDC020380 TaxID=3364309 RepID=UPI0037890E02